MEQERDVFCAPAEFAMAQIIRKCIRPSAVIATINTRDSSAEVVIRPRIVDDSEQSQENLEQFRLLVQRLAVNKNGFGEHNLISIPVEGDKVVYQFPNAVRMADKLEGIYNEMCPKTRAAQV